MTEDRVQARAASATLVSMITELSTNKEVRCLRRFKMSATLKPWCGGIKSTIGSHLI
jgi:hypothetical protein